MQSYSEQFKRWMRLELLDNKPVRNNKNTTTMHISIMPQDLIARNHYFRVLSVTTEPRLSGTNNVWLLSVNRNKQLIKLG